MKIALATTVALAAAQKNEKKVNRDKKNKLSKTILGVNLTISVEFWNFFNNFSFRGLYHILKWPFLS